MMRCSTISVSQTVPLGKGRSRLNGRNEVPFFLAVEIVDGNASRNTVAVFEIERGQRALNPVENTRDKPGRKLRGKRLARGINVLARTQSGSFLIDLNGSLISPKLDHFPDQSLVGNADDVVHFRIRHILGYDQRSRNFNCLTCHVCNPHLLCPPALLLRKCFPQKWHKHIVESITVLPPERNSLGSRFFRPYPSSGQPLFGSFAEKFFLIF